MGETVGRTRLVPSDIVASHSRTRHPSPRGGRGIPEVPGGTRGGGEAGTGEPELWPSHSAWSPSPVVRPKRVSAMHSHALETEESGNDGNGSGDEQGRREEQRNPVVRPTSGQERDRGDEGRPRPGREPAVGTSSYSSYSSHLFIKFSVFMEGVYRGTRGGHTPPAPLLVNLGRSNEDAVPQKEDRASPETQTRDVCNIYLPCCSQVHFTTSKYQ